MFFSGFLSKSKKINSDAFTIPWRPEYENFIQEAKAAVRNSKLEKALDYLFKIDVRALNGYTNQLASRLAQYERDNILGVQDYERASGERNRISRDVLKLIDAVEKSLREESEINAKIKTYLTERYQNRLDQKLAGRQAVNVRKIPSTAGTSEDTSSYFVSINSEDIQGTIQNLFEEAKGRLLITGVPGSGKTVLMLQLVLALLKKKTPAIPLVLNLATWRKSYVKLETWLEEILPAELGINSAFAKKIQKEIPLILLLDGLDEVKKQDRKSCLDAIGFYGANAQKQFAVASRIKEYIEADKDAPVYLQIELEPLQLRQIKEELKQIGYRQPEALPLLRAIETDEPLRESVKTPFYFNVLQLLFAQGKRLSDLDFQSPDPAGRKKEIIEKFLAEQLVLAEEKQGNEKTAYWLGFLASRMNKKNIVVFELTDLQYDWERWSAWQIVLGNICAGLVAGLFTGLIGGLFIGLAGSLTHGLIGGKDLIFSLAFGLVFCLFFGPIYSLVVGLFSGLFRGLIDKRIPKIETKEQVNWTLKNYFLSVKKTLSGGLVVSLVAGLIASLIGGLVVGLVLGLVTSPVIALIDLIDAKHSSFIQIRTPYQRFKSSMKAFYFSILQHWLLRYQLYKKGLLPWRLVDFLNEVTERRILESDGAAWRFRHRIIQDYFAEQRQEPKESKPNQGGRLRI